MRLQQAIDEAINGAKSLRTAEKRLFKMFECSVGASDLEYLVKPYVVRGHLRRYRRKLNLVKPTRSVA